jgi:hypothetical protein
MHAGRNSDNGLSPLRGHLSDPALTDADLVRELRHRWRCSCGHVEIATDPASLRRQALAHHADKHARRVA